MDFKNLSNILSWINSTEAFMVKTGFYQLVHELSTFLVVNCNTSKDSYWGTIIIDQHSPTNLFLTPNEWVQEELNRLYERNENILHTALIIEIWGENQYINSLNISLIEPEHNKTRTLHFNICKNHRNGDNNMKPLVPLTRETNNPTSMNEILYDVIRIFGP